MQLAFAIRLDGASPEARALAATLDPAYVAQHGVDGVVYSNPLPHVLILTAIVVGVATLAVGLAIADHVVVNDDLERTVQEMMAIIDQHRR